MDFLLRGMTGRLSDNVELRQELDGQRLNDVVYETARYLSLKHEPHVNPDILNERLERFRSTTHGTKDFVRFRVDPYGGQRRITEEPLRRILWVESSLPILDRYIGFLRGIRFLIGQDGSPLGKKQLRSYLNGVLESVEDQSLNAVRAYLDAEHAALRSEAAERFNRIVHDYTQSRYQECGTGITEMIAEGQHGETSTVCFDLIELSVRARIHAQEGVPLTFAPSSFAERIRHGLDCVLSRSDDVSDALQGLLRLAQLMSATRIGDPLFAFYIENAGHHYDYRPTQLRAICSWFLSPRFCTVFQDPQQKLHFLSSLERQTGTNSSIRLFREIVQSLSTPEDPALIDLPEARRLRYESLIALERKHWRKARDLSVDLYHASGDDRLFVNDAIVRIYEASRKLADYLRAIEVVVDAFIRAENLLTPKQVADLVDDLDAKSRAQVEGTIDLPILLAICRKLCRRPQIVGEVWEGYELFMDRIGCNRPTELLTKDMSTHPIHEDRLTLFLRMVCIPEVLDSSPIFESSEDVMAERIAILRYLDRRGPQPLYKEQISALSKAISIQKINAEVHREMIFVDKDGIRSSIEHHCTDRWARFHENAALEIQLGGLRRSTAMDPAIRAPGTTWELFRELFDLIRQTFIDSELYGLNQHLSTKVRHGTLTGRLRESFAKLGLITKLHSQTHTYGVNKRWADPAVYGKKRAKKIQRRLEVLARGVDELIRELVGKTLQVSWRSDNRTALFNYSYSAKELDSLYKRAADLDDFGSFYDLIVDDLLVRTERNCSDVEAHLKGPFLGELLELLDDTDEAASLLDAVDQGAFRRVLKQCKTKVQEVIDDVSEWFRLRSEVSAVSTPVAMSVAMQVAAESVNWGSEDGGFAPEIHCDYDPRLKGSAVEHFVDILFILLDNVAKHSALVPGTYGVNCQNTEDGDLLLSVCNPPSEAMLGDGLPQRLESIANDGRGGGRVAVEGGSGYYKLRKLLRSDLERKRYRVRVTCHAKREFRVQLRMEQDGLLA